jgi:tRNA A-37 threonylcarbamoyl transferase component Bud32
VGEPDNAVPTTLGSGRYSLIGTLGAGAMASVWRARDEVLGVDRAIKLLHPSIAANRGVRGRFEDEARTMAGLDHPHVLRVVDFGEDDGIAWFAMELVEGGSVMDEVDRRGALALADALRVAFEVATALGAAHARGVVHRDVKPHNILLSPAGARLTDFGIARVQDSVRRSRTRTGVAMGTIGYMSPEQREDAHRAGPASDLYALGVTLYVMLTGREPPELLVSDVNPHLLSDIDPVARDVIAHATRLEPTERPADARALAAALARARDAVARRQGEAQPGSAWMARFDELVRALPPPVEPSPAADTWLGDLDEDSAGAEVSAPAPRSEPTSQAPPTTGLAGPRRGIGAVAGALGIAAVASGAAAVAWLGASDAAACVGTWRGTVGRDAPIELELSGGFAGRMVGEVRVASLDGTPTSLAVAGRCAGGELSLVEVADVADRGRYAAALEGELMVGTFTPEGGAPVAIRLQRTSAP